MDTFVAEAMVLPPIQHEDSRFSSPLPRAELPGGDQVLVGQAGRGNHSQLPPAVPR